MSESLAGFGSRTSSKVLFKTYRLLTCFLVFQCTYWVVNFSTIGRVEVGAGECGRPGIAGQGSPSESPYNIGLSN